jgi:hypothetical protein
MKEITYVGMVLPNIMKLSIDFETNSHWKITEIDDEVNMTTSIKNSTINVALTDHVNQSLQPA